MAICLFEPCLAAEATLPDFRFSATALEYGDHRLSGVVAELQTGGDFRIRMDGYSDTASGRSLDAMELDGRLDVWTKTAEGYRADGLIRFQGLDAAWSFRTGDTKSALCLETAVRPLEELARRTWPLEGAAWLRRGDLDACVHYRESESADTTLAFDIALADLSFDSPEGRFAGEGMALELAGQTVLTESMTTRIEGNLNSGQVLIDAFYADFGEAPLRFGLEPEFGKDGINVLSLSVNDGGALDLDARVDTSGGGDGWAAEVHRLELRFPEAYGRYLEPAAAAWTLDGLEVTGSLEWQGALSATGMQSGDLDIVDLSIVDVRRNRFALTGLETRLRPGDQSFESALRWRGLLLGKINLGAGSALLDSEQGAFALAGPMELDVLGGKLRFGKLRYIMPGSPMAEEGVSRFEMESSVSHVDMEQLTAALDWPAFSGSLSGEIPGVRLEDGVLSADGEIRVEVFGGEVSISDLAAERPFGVLPSLSADVVMTDLDLEQLTDTFEFGRIGGRVDGYISGLRLLDWEPVAFDAWLGTPKRQTRARSISRQAVNNLTTIGGGGATAALASPFMRLFSKFSYKRLGLGCRLQNYVCEITGVSEDGESVLLMEGAGIPRITVRAWNRQVDWPQMVANLGAITAGESIRVGDAPQP